MLAKMTGMMQLK